MTFRNVLAILSYYPSLQVKTKRNRAKKLLTQSDFLRLPWKPHIFACKSIFGDFFHSVLQIFNFIHSVLQIFNVILNKTFILILISLIYLEHYLRYGRKTKINGHARIFIGYHGNHVFSL